MCACVRDFCICTSDPTVQRGNGNGVILAMITRGFRLLRMAAAVSSALAAILCVSLPASVSSQYLPDWASLDSRLAI